MSGIKVLSVFGTRPEAIKMAPVIRELEKREKISSFVCVTAQHREMLDQVLEVFGIRPDWDLNLMHGSQTLSDITAGVLVGMEGVLRRERPSVVLVHGDTSTALAAALAAFYAQIPIGHVEAGLRTGDKYSPFPEELNRRLIDAFADMLFAPTQLNRRRLLSENIPAERIYVTGSTAIDALSCTVRSDYHSELLDALGENERLILLTSHRRENLGEKMGDMFAGIRRAAEELEDVRIIYPLHRNPAVREAAHSAFDGCGRVWLIEPLDAVDFHNFLSRACLVLTDSGGIQEEAAALGKPVLVLRHTTERQEGIAAGSLKLVGTDGENIYREIKRLLTDRAAYEAMSRPSSVFGDGHAAKRIADAIEAYFEV